MKSALPWTVSDHPEQLEAYPAQATGASDQATHTNQSGGENAVGYTGHWAHSGAVNYGKLKVIKN